MPLNNKQTNKSIVIYLWIYENLNWYLTTEVGVISL